MPAALAAACAASATAPGMMFRERAVGGADDHDLPPSGRRDGLRLREDRQEHADGAVAGSPTATPGATRPIKEALRIAAATAEEQK